jgi:hypothetical protein
VTIKNLVLASLLMAFAFVVIHDFTISSIDPDTQAELSYCETDKSSLDMASMIHDNIHSELLCEGKRHVEGFILERLTDSFEVTTLFIFASTLSLYRPPTA